GDKDEKRALELLERILPLMEQGTGVRALELSEDERALLAPLQLLTAKPTLYLANVAESQIGAGRTDPRLQKVVERARTESSEVLMVCAQIEAELAQLPK